MWYFIPHYVVGLYYVIQASYIVATWLAEKQLTPVISANLIRLVSLLVGIVFATWLLLNHGLVVVNAPAFVCASVVFLMALWQTALWAYDWDIRYVLTSLAAVPGLVFVMLAGGFYLTVGLFPSLFWLMMISSLACCVPSFLRKHYGYAVFDVMHAQFNKHPHYRDHLQALAKDLPTSARGAASQLSFSILQWFTIAQSCLSILPLSNSLTAWLCIALLCVVTATVVYQAHVAVGLVALCNKEKRIITYRYGFVVQLYLNFWITFQKVWHQTVHNQLPSVRLERFVLVLLMAATQSTVSYCDDGSSVSGDLVDDSSDDQPLLPLQGQKGQAALCYPGVGDESDSGPIAEGVEGRKALEGAYAQAKPHLKAAGESRNIVRTLAGRRWKNSKAMLQPL